jgi:hypothetical protein
MPYLCAIRVRAGRYFAGECPACRGLAHPVIGWKPDGMIGLVRVPIIRLASSLTLNHPMLSL